MTSITTVLLDLDGVVRHFDPAHAAAVEATYGLDVGCLNAAGFESGLIQQLITGRITRAEWGDQVGERVGSVEAARAWLVDIGTVDPEILAVVDELRSAGLVVAILTNGTDTIPSEMITLGLAERFDRIFNTSEIGYAKADARSFAYVCQALEVEPASVFFTDDSQSNLGPASSLGMTARLFEGVPAFRTHLTELGIDPPTG